jgi:hypothetical protein
MQNEWIICEDCGTEFKVESDNSIEDPEYCAFCGTTLVYEYPKDDETEEADDE